MGNRSSTSTPRTFETKLSVHHGDITKLKVQAIVNASNEAASGCISSTHCIDGAIHAAAGYDQLREACSVFKDGLPTAKARITSAFALPSSHIIHVTGPRACMGLNYELLKSCYTSCLQVAFENNIKQIAFCCISTGVFGYPKEESAATAIAAVTAWISAHPTYLQEVIFCVYTMDDLEIYSRLLK